MLCFLEGALLCGKGFVFAFDVLHVRCDRGVVWGGSGGFSLILIEAYLSQLSYRLSLLLKLKIPLVLSAIVYTFTRLFALVVLPLSFQQR